MCLLRLLWNVIKVSSSSSSLWYNDRLQPKCCISAIFALFFLHILHQGPGPLLSLLILVLVTHWIPHSCPFIAPLVQSFSSESVSDYVLTIRCRFLQFYRQREAKRHHHLWRRWRLSSRRDTTVSDRCLRWGQLMWEISDQPICFFQSKGSHSICFSCKVTLLFCFLYLTCL